MITIEKIKGTGLLAPWRLRIYKFIKFNYTKMTALSLLSIILLSRNAGHTQSQLPGTWQTSMVLTMNYGGGMAPYAYKIEINETESSLVETRQGQEKKTIRKLTTAELDELL